MNGVVEFVDNTHDAYNEAYEYYHIWLEDENGGNERAVMMTTKEFDSLATITLPNELKEEMIFGRLYPAIINRQEKYIVRIALDGEDNIYILTEKFIEYCRKRTEKHKDMILEKGFIEDLFD